MSKETKNIMIRGIPEEIHRYLRFKAADSDKSVNQVVVDIITNHYKNPRNSAGLKKLKL